MVFKIFLFDLLEYNSEEGDFLIPLILEKYSALPELFENFDQVYNRLLWLAVLLKNLANVPPLQTEYFSFP